MQNQNQNQEWVPFMTARVGSSNHIAIYEVNRNAEIRRRLPHRDNKCIPVNQSLSGGMAGNRYMCIPSNAKKYVHRIVAETFIPNPDNLPHVNHIDGNKLNNAIENLEWCTSSYNMYHYYRSEAGQRNRANRSITMRNAWKTIKEGK